MLITAGDNYLVKLKPSNEDYMIIIELQTFLHDCYNDSFANIDTL